MAKVDAVGKGIWLTQIFAAKLENAQVRNEAKPMQYSQRNAIKIYL